MAALTDPASPDQLSPTNCPRPACLLQPVLSWSPGTAPFLRGGGGSPGPGLSFLICVSRQPSSPLRGPGTVLTTVCLPPSRPPGLSRGRCPFSFHTVRGHGVTSGPLPHVSWGPCEPLGSLSPYQPLPRAIPLCCCSLGGSAGLCVPRAVRFPGHMFPGASLRMGLETPACLRTLLAWEVPARHPHSPSCCACYVQLALQIGELRLRTQAPTGGLGWGRSGPPDPQASLREHVPGTVCRVGCVLSPWGPWGLALCRECPRWAVWGPVGLLALRLPFLTWQWLSPGVCVSPVQTPVPSPTGQRSSGALAGWAFPGLWHAPRGSLKG
ncbi:uncharacterized protein LOC125088741 [Lutra lutra]|uniref:uncharacterized protein LOC125088741 n=1 Tax=Lutra lutra TaxID=9657 RepID=UPI001FD44C47|nr:uncharacterized protein LOC125088741 [Lutra lutra]XP_047566100.1 uncharacterized protein LOC125088741 [Lutra lutra]